MYMTKQITIFNSVFCKRKINQIRFFEEKFRNLIMCPILKMLNILPTHFITTQYHWEGDEKDVAKTVNLL